MGREISIGSGWAVHHWKLATHLPVLFIHEMGVYRTFVILILSSVATLWVSAQTDKVTTTPALIQQGFGPGGSLLPGDGANYCLPTSSANSVLWLEGAGKPFSTPGVGAS